MLKEKIDKLDKEINLLMDIYPPIRSSGSLRKGTRGWRQKIREKGLVFKKVWDEYEIELSNEDIRTLIDIRTAETEALKQVLNELE
jgi:hypothetical protein